MQWVGLAVGLILGMVVGFLIARLRWSERTAVMQAELGTQKERLAATEKSLQETDYLRGENEQLKVQIARLEEERKANKEKLQWVKGAQQQLRETFEALASQALASNADQFLKRARDQLTSLLTQVRGDWGTHKEELKNLVQPLEKTLEAMDKQVRELEQKREGAYQSLEKHLGQLGQAQTQLRDTTVTLAQALKSSTVRGRWGELQLRRVMELAGMTSHVDFDEQVTTDEGRPDVIVHLPNQGILPVDAKTPMTAYLAAIEADETEQRAKLVAHAQAMRDRIQELGRKQYWDQFERAPEMVIMFVPSEACLSAAFEQDPALLEFGMGKHVLVTTPLTLLALLRAVAYGWQQQQITENVREIARQGQELYDRVVKFLDLFQKTGKGLEQAVEAYDSAVGSLELRLLPSARRFKELNASTKDLPEPSPVNRRTRSLSSPEADDGAE